MSNFKFFPAFLNSSHHEISEYVRQICLNCLILAIERPEHRPSWGFCYQKQLFINKSSYKSDKNLQWGKFGQKSSTDSQTNRLWALDHVKMSMESHG